MGKRPTIQMIADQAGVSRGTVDRVLNGRSYVRAEVRERILQVIQETGYLTPREAHSSRLLPSEPPVQHETRPLRLGVVLQTREDREELLRGVREARESLPDAQIAIRCCDLLREVWDCLEEFRQMDGVAICASRQPDLERQVASLTEQGVPCVTFHEDLPESRRLFFSGQDARREGRVAAELMGKCVIPGQLVLAVAGSLRSDAQRSRMVGFRERLRELGWQEESILTAETFNDAGTTVFVVSEALRKNATLRGIYMAGREAAACAAAIRTAGRKGRVRMICHGGNQAVRDLLHQGFADFALPEYSAEEGRLALSALTEYLRTGRHPSREQRPISILCAENS